MTGAKIFVMSLFQRFRPKKPHMWTWMMLFFWATHRNRVILPAWMATKRKKKKTRRLSQRFLWSWSANVVCFACLMPLAAHVGIYALQGSWTQRKPQLSDVTTAQENHLKVLIYFQNDSNLVSWKVCFLSQIGLLHLIQFESYQPWQTKRDYKESWPQYEGKHYENRPTPRTTRTIPAIQVWHGHTVLWSQNSQFGLQGIGNLE